MILREVMKKRRFQGNLSGTFYHVCVQEMKSCRGSK